MKERWKTLDTQIVMAIDIAIQEKFIADSSLSGRPQREIECKSGPKDRGATQKRPRWNTLEKRPSETEQKQAIFIVTLVERH